MKKMNFIFKTQVRHKMTEHAMSLTSPWFEFVQNGKKIYEGRRCSEKIKSIQNGDVIRFTHNLDTEKTTKMVVTEKLLFATFEEAFMVVPVEMVLPLENMSDNKGIEIYEKIYPSDVQKRDGVCLLRMKRFE